MNFSHFPRCSSIRFLERYNFNTCKYDDSGVEQMILETHYGLFINCIAGTDANRVIYTFVTLQIDSLMRLYVGNSESLRLSNLLCELKSFRF